MHACAYCKQLVQSNTPLNVFSQYIAHEISETYYFWIIVLIANIVNMLSTVREFYYY